MIIKEMVMDFSKLTTWVENWKNTISHFFQAYMFHQLLEALKNHNNIFKIVSTATYK